MTGWKEVLAHLASDVEGHFDKLKYRLAQRFSSDEPVYIQTYRAFGTPEKLFVKGRVLENRPLPLSDANDKLWDDLVHMYQRFESDEIPYARVAVRFQGEEVEATADEEGYFEAWLTLPQPLVVEQPWQAVEVRLLSPERPGFPPAQAEAKVFIPPPGAQYGVISDIDDTVVKSDAAHVLKMARNVFISNARTRLPFKGVAAFYRALARGAARRASNPMFFISSSPWNLYDLLSEFFELNQIAKDPILFLRDWGVTKDEILPTGHRQHKMQVIQRILETYPDQHFLLMGDSGQEDPEIYADVVDAYPKRILAVYIRNVSRNLARPEAIRELAKRVTEAGSTLILADDTVPLAQHAISQGWIAADELPAIREDKRTDEAPPSPIEKALGVEPAPAEQAPTVVVDGAHPAATKQAVDEGLIEKSLETGKEEGKDPPTVIVTGK